MFKVNDRVILQVRKSGGPGRSNPTIGSRYFCPGTIIFFDENDDFYEVRWDNGSSNVYRSCDLLFYEERSSNNDVLKHDKTINIIFHKGVEIIDHGEYISDIDCKFFIDKSFIDSKEENIKIEI